MYLSKGLCMVTDPMPTPGDRKSWNDDNHLYLGAILVGTRVLGPGLRSTVWVKGCPFNCLGCISPNWKGFQMPDQVIPPEDLVEQLLPDNITGLTFSGGEPMLQAPALLRLVKLAKRNHPDLDIICFTGYTFEDLVNKPPNLEITSLLREIDVLIDGPYISEFNNNLGLRGSCNQRIILLSERSKTGELNRSYRKMEFTPRKNELYIYQGTLMMAGIPTAQVNAVLERTMTSGLISIMEN
jgi:anaerobic ribonucleoside-triphosphate reductase activating protein